YVVRVCTQCLACPISAVVTAALSLVVFLNDTATTEIYTLSLHDALPISSRKPPASALGSRRSRGRRQRKVPLSRAERAAPAMMPDRKSTRLNSSHVKISYAVFCLKKKKKRNEHRRVQQSLDRHHDITTTT